MAVTPKVLVVGFEAMDRDVAASAVAAGRMPVLAALQREGLTVAMANPIGMLTGPVWATFATGVHPDRHNRLNWRALRPGTYRMEWLGPYSAPDQPPFWERLATQGIASLVMSLPTVETGEHPLVTQVLDWHTHDRRSPLRTSPAPLVDELTARFGAGSVDRCDRQGADGALDALVPRLCAEAVTFADGVEFLVDRVAPDVVVAVSGASHCAGHQLWHLHDDTSPRHHPVERARLGDALLEVYDALDTALGHILDRAGPDTLVVVVLSHGMGENVVMPHLADPIVRAIDDSMGGAPRLHHAREVLRRTPNRVARLWRRVTGRPLDTLAHIADGSRRFFPVENFPTHAALRLNMVGREPNGRVERSEVPALVDRLEAELLAVLDADTGRPVVGRLIRLADHFNDIDGSSLADLLVEWTGDGVVERVTSPTIGTIDRPCRETRTGAHRQDGMLVLRGAGIEAGTVAEASSVDVWPTVASWLGVDPGDVDGRPLHEASPSPR
jgi:predicted AlkP superfamily phosphohydrolase/phosphomutase